ncbi:hypothetical protein CA11_08150 [Gimesia maris]|nr:hypothetical protein CA11_08150 [Gimesia maris]
MGGVGGINLFQGFGIEAAETGMRGIGSRMGFIAGHACCGFFRLNGVIQITGRDKDRRRGNALAQPIYASSKEFLDDVFRLNGDEV